MVSSSSFPLGHVLKLGRFEPAKVQREFQWRTVHVDRLLSDLVSAFQRMGLDEPEAEDEASAEDDEAGDEPQLEQGMEEDEAGARPAATVVRLPEPVRQAPDVYFLGSIILFKSSEESRNHIVYDGLQRLTTLNILLAVLRDTWTDLGEADALSLRSLLFNAEHRRLNFPTTGQSLASIISQRPLQRRDLTDGDYKMREAVDYFTKKFAAGWSSTRRRSFLEFLQERVQVTVTETGNHSVAYQMFIGANTRGLRLDIGDVLKGMIADLVRSKGGTVAQIEACAKGWRDAQLSLRGSFSDTLHAIETFKFRADQPPGHASKPVTRHVTGEKLQEFLDTDDMDPAAVQAWIEGEFASMVLIFERAREHYVQNPASGIDICYRQLSFLGWTEWQPLLVAIGVKFGVGKKAANTRVRDLCRACYLVELLELSEWTRRRKFMDAILQLEAGKDPFHRGGALAFGKRAMSIASRRLRIPITSAEKRGTIVRWLETLLWGQRLPISATNFASVEHVLPVTGTGEWSKLFTEDEQEKLTHTIGNLCILDKKANERVGNREWAAKRSEYEGYRTTFKSVASVLAASERALEADSSRPWTAAAIQERTHELASLAEKALLIAE